VKDDGFGLRHHTKVLEDREEIGLVPHGPNRLKHIGMLDSMLWNRRVGSSEPPSL